MYECHSFAVDADYSDRMSVQTDRHAGAHPDPAAGDGHLELYKSTMKYDGDVGRGQHGLPSHKETPR